MTKTSAQRREKLSRIHPGEILAEEFLIPMKISQYRLARAIGVDARRVHAIVHGERSITAETAFCSRASSATPRSSGWDFRASTTLNGNGTGWRTGWSRWLPTVSEASPDSP